MIVRRRRTLPIPPAEMRDLVGAPEPERFDNPTGGLVYPYLPAAAYESVLDLGCGCGRVARQLIQQRPRPTRYVGVDLHRGMIDWCRRELAPRAPGFRFEHHDVYSAGLNPHGAHRVLALPADDERFSLMLAISVFTHSAQDQAEHYLREAARVLRPDGYLLATWFLFDKALFPMLQPAQNALYINEIDPSNAVILDRRWVIDTARRAGLVASWVRAPEIRGFHWHVVMRPVAAGDVEVELGADDAPLGSHPPPLMPPDAQSIGSSDADRAG